MRLEHNKITKKEVAPEAPSLSLKTLRPSPPVAYFSLLLSPFTCSHRNFTESTRCCA